MRSDKGLRALVSLLLPLLAAMACGGSLLYGEPREYEGRTIMAIAFDPARQPEDAKELESLLAVRTNASLRIADVRRSIERLYATGRYEDITVDAEPAGLNGVSVVFHTKNSWFIGHVSVSDTVSDPPNNGQLVNATQLDLGQPFQASDVQAARDRILRLLVQNGYYEAAVDSHVTYTDEAQQVNISFDLNAGKRAHFWEPRISGDVQLPEDKIIRATRWKKWFHLGWQPVTQAHVRDGLQGVRSKFEKEDRLLATVQLKALDYDADVNRATPQLEIQAGPKVVIKALGAKVKRTVLENNVPVYQEHTVDQDLLEEGRRNLREEFQSKGYFDATVEYEAKPVVSGSEEIDYRITPGELHSFVKLTIQGNKYFKTDSIRERMFLTPKSLQYRHGRYSEAFVRRDGESIRNLYRSNGFRDVAVTTESVDDYLGKKGQIAVTVRIVEGPQYLVSSLRVTGAGQLDLKSILPTLSSTEDQPFSEFNVAADRETIITHYGENGFPNATLEYTTRPGVQPYFVEVEFHITEGPRQSVREVITSGLTHTQQKLVDRMVTFKAGDPLSPERMAETQKRLYDLGVFAKVDMAIQNPDGAEDRKYVVYDMDEARRYSFVFGFGAQIANIGGSNAAANLSDPAGRTGFSPRVSFDVTRINFLGLGHTISFRSRYSSLDRRGLIDYLAPRIFDHDNLDLNFTILVDASNDVRTFASTREEGSIQLTDRLSKSLTAFFRFAYRHVTVGNLKIDPLLLPRLAQSEQVGLLSANFIQDRRDDPTDPHKGIYNTVDIGIASTLFGSQSSFVRFLARNATYHRVTKKIVLARQTQFGDQPAFRIPENADPSDPLPLPERFYGGGGSSHRGFPENQAGPRDLKTGFPLGGSALFFNTTELRFPLLGDNIGGVIFHDFGNTFDRLSDISFRVNQRNLQDFNYMVHAVGFGIRYRTPIGPVRLDLADSINSPRFNGFGGTYDQLVQCSINNNCVSATQRVSRFQFFFSIGQAF